MRKAFVSYNYENRELAHNVNTLLPLNIIEALIIHVNSNTKSLIDKEIRISIKESNIVVFIIGNNSHNSPWINREAELAISMNKPILCIRYPETTGSTPQKLVKCDILDWDANTVHISIKNMIRDLVP